MESEVVRVAVKELRGRQEGDGESSKVPERSKARKKGVLQILLLGAETVGRYMHAYRDYRSGHKPSRNNLEEEDTANIDKNAEVGPKGPSSIPS